MLDTEKQRKLNAKFSYLISLEQRKIDLKQQRWAQSIRKIDTLNKVLLSYFNISKSELYASSRQKASIALIRQIAMYICHVNFSLTYTEIGIVFGRDRTTASHACRLIEDKRDNPKFDSAIGQLELVLKNFELCTNKYRQMEKVNEH